MISELTVTETSRLTDLETVIERGLQTFVEVGNALMEIRDSRLYREQHGTFEDYCRERWAISKIHAYRLMGAAQVVTNLESNQLVTLPANEAQARALSKLAPQFQREVWPIVVDTAPNGNITANHVQRVVDDYLRHDEHLDAALADESKPVCQECGQVYDGEACPDCHPLNGNGFNYKRDTRRSVAADIYTPQGMDACQTPPYAIDPLLPYLQEGWNIWEPACGEGYLEGALYDSGFSVTPSDILTGQNFFEFDPGNWDCLITNPPFSIKYQWLERCYQLGKPFALLLQVEVLGTKTAQEMFEKYGVEIIFVRPRINFKMPNKGWDGGGSQFPTAWFTWGLNVGRQMTFARVVPDDNFG